MKTLVLIPAFGCDARLYAPQIAALEGRVSCIVHAGRQDRYEAMVATLLAEVPGDFAVLGTSMGGRLALEVALAAPDRVEGLCVIGAGAGGTADPAPLLRRSARVRSGEKGAVLQEMSQIISHKEGPRGMATREAFISMGHDFDTEALARQSDALAHRTDKWEQLAGISCPSLFLWGVHDQFSPAADGARMAEMVQDGSYVELPDCGHFPTLEYPDQATDAIAAWLDDAGVI